MTIIFQNRCCHRGASLQAQRDHALPSPNIAAAYIGGHPGALKSISAAISSWVRASAQAQAGKFPERGTCLTDPTKKGRLPQAHCLLTLAVKALTSGKVKMV